MYIPSGNSTGDELAISPPQRLQGAAARDVSIKVEIEMTTGGPRARAAGPQSRGAACGHGLYAGGADGLRHVGLLGGAVWSRDRGSGAEEIQAPGAA